MTCFFMSIRVKFMSNQKEKYFRNRKNISSFCQKPTLFKALWHKKNPDQIGVCLIWSR